MSNMYKRTKRDPRYTPKRRNPVTYVMERFKSLFRPRSTKPWKANISKKPVPWTRILAPILIVVIPISVMMATDNVLLRLPDLYKYQLLSSEVLDQKMISASEDDLSNLFADYMGGRTNRFQMKEDLEYLPDDLFSKADGRMMGRFRTFLEAEMWLGIVCIGMSTGLTLFLLRNKKRDLLFRTFLMSIPAFLIFQGLDLMMMLIGPLRSRVYGIESLTGLEDANLLPAILDGSFFRIFALSETVISLVFMALLYYLMLNLSGRRVTFRR